MIYLKLEIKIEYPDERTASLVSDAVHPDNTGYVESEVRGNILVFHIEADSAGSMKNTADDLLACVKLAEEASGVVVSGTNLNRDSLSE